MAPTLDPTTMWFNTAFEQRAQHADLNRAQAPPAGEDKGRFRWGHHGTPTFPEVLDVMVGRVPVAVRPALLIVGRFAKLTGASSSPAVTRSWGPRRHCLLLGYPHVNF